MVAEQSRALLHGTESQQFKSPGSHHFLKPGPNNFKDSNTWRRWKAKRRWKAERGDGKQREDMES